MISRALAILLALALLLAGGVWQQGRVALATEQAAHAKTGRTLEGERRSRAEALETGIQQARQQDLRTITNQREALDAAYAKTDALQRDRDRAAASASSLRDALAAERARSVAAAADSHATEGCRAAARTASVLADLLERVSEERRELADYADRARIAGQLCERSYRALSPP